MKNTKIIRKGLAAVAMAALALGIAGTGTANASAASENAYLNELVRNGITIYDAAWAIERGYEICGLLQHEDGNAAARDLFHNTTWTETPNLHTAQVMVSSAADTLCPWAWQTSVPAQYS
jgi:hypothetical protein